MKINLDRNIKRIIKNNEGAILIQLIFVGIMVAGLTYFVMQKTGETSWTLSKVRYASDVRHTTNEIYSYLNNKDNCKATFTSNADGTLNADGTFVQEPINIVNFINKDTTVANRVTRKYHRKDTNEGRLGYGASFLKINSYRLESVAGEWKLLINYQNHNMTKGVSENDEFGRLIRMVVNLDGAGKLDTCYSIADNSLIWQRDNAAPEDIFYIGQVYVADMYDDGNDSHFRRPHAKRHKLFVVKKIQEGLLDPMRWDVIDENGVNLEEKVASQAVFQGYNPYFQGDESGYGGVGDPNQIAMRSFGDVRVVGYDHDNDNSTPNIPGQYFYFSDKRLKNNIQQIEDPLEKVENLRGVSFDWEDSSKRSLGFIAQEVEDVLPELVITAKDDTKSVDYLKVVPVLVEAFKQQQKRIELLKAKIKSLK